MAEVKKTQLEIGQEINIKPTGFRFIRDFAAVTFKNAQGERDSAIIGTQTNWPFERLVQLGKCAGITLSFQGEVESANGTKYNKYYIENFAVKQEDSGF